MITHGAVTIDPSGFGRSALWQSVPGIISFHPIFFVRPSFYLPFQRMPLFGACLTLQLVLFGLSFLTRLFGRSTDILLALFLHSPFLKCVAGLLLLRTYANGARWRDQPAAIIRRGNLSVESEGFRYFPIWRRLFVSSNTRQDFDTAFLPLYSSLLTLSLQ